MPIYGPACSKKHWHGYFASRQISRASPALNDGGLRSKQMDVVGRWVAVGTAITMLVELLYFDATTREAGEDLEFTAQC